MSHGTSCVVYWVNVLLRLKSLVYSFISQRKPWPTGCLCLALPAVLLINCGHCCTASTPNKSNQSFFFLSLHNYFILSMNISHIFSFITSPTMFVNAAHSSTSSLLLHLPAPPSCPLILMNLTGASNMVETCLIL